MKYLKIFLKERKLKNFLNVIFILGQSVGTLLIPFLIAKIIDEGILTRNIDKIVSLGIQMVVVTLISTIVAVLGSYYSADLASEFGFYIRDKILRKTQELSISQFDNIGVSSMITRTTADIAFVQQTLGLIFQLVVPAFLIVGASIVMTIYSNAYLSLILVLNIIIFLIVSVFIFKRSTVISKRLQRKLDKINQIVRESITGIRVIRAFANEKHEEKRADKAFVDYADDVIKINKLFAILNPVVWFIVGIAMAVIIYLGSILTLNQVIEVGQITAVSEYIIITMSYLITATTIIVTFPKMKSCLDRMEEVLEINSDIIDEENVIDEKEESKVLEFDKVNFFYKGAEEPVIKDLSFSCEAGETIAIIGSTGSGKSTIANLILRLHDIDSGSIRLEGRNIRSLSQEKLREEIAYVPQKAFLFSGTIKDNLRMGYREATEEEMYRALKISQAYEFVNGLPKKLDYEVAQGGSNFSGGQKQRLAIARALIKKAKVYIFDDSFSALDLKTDSLLRKAIKDSIQDSIKIIIAQRVSTIIDADKILVLDEGKLVGIGKHKELIKNCQVYKSIASSQMKVKEA